METHYKNIMTESNIMTTIKWGLALVIIAMGSYGYNRFFSSPDSTEPIWLVVILFIIIEAAILTMTTINFSTTLKQKKTIGYGLGVAVVMMWLISGVGIDQTIWGMVESKYHTVKLNETAVIADKETEQLLKRRISHLQSQQKLYKNEIISLVASKIRAKKAYDKASRQLKDIIWYSGKRCDLSSDCTARKNVAENALNLAKQSIDDYILSIKIIKEKIIANDRSISNAKINIEAIVSNRVKFEKNNRVTLKNKKEEALVHIKLMDFLNNVLGLKIETPERAYVILLSFIIYPIYILFIAFMASNSPEMKKLRAQQAELLKRELATKETSPQKAQKTIQGYLRKIIAYLISTRTRKVIVKEIEIEIEVIKEVEKIIYKDGKEIITVEIEVPHIIEKEIIVEKIIEKLIIEKEFITVPVDINLNELNKITGHGSTPKNLEEVIEKINKETTKQEAEPLEGVNNDKHKAS